MAKKSGKEGLNLLNFIAEAGMLKRVRRSGWWVLGIKDTESVADHSFRCAVLGYVMAHMEKANSYKVMLMCLFNDIHEARINDLHKMSQKYIDIADAENNAFFEQVNGLPEGMKKELSGMRKEYINQKTKEALIARDADILECMIQAKEYYDRGLKEAIKFMDIPMPHLKTKSARQLWAKAKKTNVNNWWVKLTEFKR